MYNLSNRCHGTALTKGEIKAILELEFTSVLDVNKIEYEYDKNKICITIKNEERTKFILGCNKIKKSNKNTFIWKVSDLTNDMSERPSEFAFGKSPKATFSICSAN